MMKWVGRFLVATISLYPIYGADECHLSAESPCSIETLNTTTKIFPGGATGCFRDKTPLGKDNPYFFQVSPGAGLDASNLLLHFQGGGGCFSDVLPCNAARSPSLQDRGIFHRGTSLNPYKDWTLVIVTYCSGDFHVGDTVKGRFNFRGRQNTLAVLDYVYANLPHPHRVVVTGTSAGSIGLHYWSYTLAQHYTALDPAPTSLAFVFASYILTDADRGIDDAMRDLYDTCHQESFQWTAELEQSCREEPFFANKLQLLAQEEFREFPFIFLSYKNDRYQRRYGKMKQALLEYVEAAPTAADNNVVSFFVNRFGHVLLDTNRGFYRQTNGPGESVLDLMTVVARYDNATRIDSSCRWAPGIPTRTWCHRTLTEAAFQSEGTPNVELCRRARQSCSADAECCSGTCRQRLLFPKCRRARVS